MAKRDLRAQIRADHELYKELDDEFHRNALKASIDARLEHLALRSMPLEYEGRQSVQKYRSMVALGLLLAAYGLMLVATWSSQNKAKGNGVAMSWAYEHLWVGLAVALGGSMLCGLGLRHLAAERVIAQLKQFQRFLQMDISRFRNRSGAPVIEDGPGSAGTPPDQEDTA